jgi:hypothetical protein
MHSHVRKYLIGLAFALVVLAAAVPAAATAATESTTLRFSGLAADVGFLQVNEAGCVYTFVENFGVSGRATESRAGSTKQVNLEAFVDILNVCDPNNPVETLLICSSDSATVNIDRQLTMATVSGTLTCSDFYTGEEICQLSKSETLQGVGDTVTQLEHFQYRQGGFLFNGTFRGQFRDAQVTSASVTGCGVSLTEQDVYFAVLESVNTAQVSVSRA